MFIDRLNEAISWGRQNTTNFIDGNQFLTDFNAYVNPRSANEVARSAGSGTGPIAPQDLRGMSVDLDTGYDSKWSDMFCREMDMFAVGYSNALAKYRGQINKTYDVVSQALQAFIDTIKILDTDPFRTNGSSGSSGTGGSKKSTGGTGIPGGSANSGGGSMPSMPPMTAPSVDIPAMPAPSVPPMTLPETAQPDPNAPVINPVTHAAAVIDPSTGQPYPIDPRTGLPVSNMDTF